MAGTMCGGMDQTISILGEKRKAKRVEFYPKITTETVVLPESLRVVVSNTCNSVPKLNTLGTRFNRRVLECQFITAAMGMESGQLKKWEDCHYKNNFKQLQLELGYSLDQMIELADKTFSTKGPMTYAEISKKWNVEDPFVICDYINHWQSVRDMNTSLELYNRAMYILTEAKRV